jgi:phage terminase large subunit-like protein
MKAGSGFTHDGCPVTAQHVRNARKAPRPGQKYVLAKHSQGQKIDMAVVSVLCHEAAGDVTAAGLWPKPKAENVIWTASSTRR